MFLLLINCCLTTVGPLYIIYKGTILSESTGALILCFRALALYFLTRFCQTLLVITLTTDFVESIWILSNFVMAFTNIVDVLGIHFLMKTKISTSFDLETRLLAIGLGWAAADAFSNHLVWFFIEAKRAELGWTFIQRTLTSNLSTVSCITLTVLVNLWTRPNNSFKKGFFLTKFIIFQTIGIPFIINCFEKTNIVAQNEWLTFILQTILVISSALLTKFLHDNRISDKWN